MQLLSASITSLLYTAIRQIWHGGYDVLTANEAICFQNVLQAERAEYEFDIADLHLTKARFTKLVRQYLNPVQVHRFLATARDISTARAKEGAICALQTVPIRPSATSHKFGNCILGFSFSGQRSPRAPVLSPTLTMHSRTAYLSYIGCLDLALAFCLIRELSLRVEIPPRDFRFVWVADSLQFHILKSLPLMRNQPHLLERCPRNLLQKQVITWHKKLSNPDSLNGELSYGPVRRVFRAYSTRRPDPCPVDTLTLDSLTGAR